MKKHIAIIFFVGSVVWMAKKFHLQNFWKGDRQIRTLLENKSLRKENLSKSEKFIYIAHAGGGLKGRTYLNTLEAIDNSLNLGVNFIEIDLHYTTDSAVVLSHDFVNIEARQFLEDRTIGTHLLLEDLMLWLKDKNIYLITDIKSDNVKILKKIVTNYPEQSKRIIPQAYTISEIGMIKVMGFENVIFTNYASGYPNSILESLANSEILFGLALPYDINFKLLGFSFDLKKSRIRILTHTVNDFEVSTSLRESGCDGIYTDFLLSPSIK